MTFRELADALRFDPEVQRRFTDPICELCENALAVEVHHRVPLADGSEPYRLGIR